MELMDFYKGKRVFVTGHTGFKGTWLCGLLASAGAEVSGFALEPPTEPNLFAISGVGGKIRSTIGDIRDFAALKAAFDAARPEIVLHLAAQPIVREGYKSPAYTYEVNVMGTVNLLECVRESDCVRSVLNVTTDKVYRNREWEWGYRETDELDGFDPYSNSKSCSELVTHSYRSSFLAERGIAVSTARAGNVIGGGDFAADRIIPDCVRAAMAGEPIIVRNPYSTRPYQHVLEPLYVYLTLARRQYEDAAFAGAYNVGPDDRDCVTTGELVGLFCDAWGNGQRWRDISDCGPHEAGVLKLDCSKIKKRLGWSPVWHVGDAVERTVEWTRCYLSGGDAGACMEKQAEAFFADARGSVNEILRCAQNDSAGAE